MADKGSEDEFDLIKRHFAPLSVGAPGALNLTDDAAILELAPGKRLVAATDALVAGVHFLADDPAGDIAKKLVRVNLSDLAAMGATPFAMLLAAVFPKNTNDDWMTAFSTGLGEDVAEFGVPLVGGDTVAVDGIKPLLTLALTALGHVPGDQALTRQGADVGDGIYVSGTLGDGLVGLEVAKGGWEALSSAHRDFVLQRFRLPTPRLGLGQALLGVASAAIDISDGLLGDLDHICDWSGVGAEISAHALPLSKATQTALRIEPGLPGRILGGGDDYELLFTAPAVHNEMIRDRAEKESVRVTKIGTIVENSGKGVVVTDLETLGLELPRSGYRHF